MGIDDRDYMRERARQRVWNERKGRVELDSSTSSGAWFEPKNGGFDYQKDRWQQRERGPSTAWAGRGRRIPFGRHPLQGWIFALAAIGPLIGFYQAAQRSGWVGEWSGANEVPFPASGSVTVNAAIDPRSAISRFRVTTADANAVAQLFTLSGVHVISLYVRKNSDVTTRVPPGRYTLKVAEGQRWFGDERFFSTSMTFETAVDQINLTPERGGGIDLHRTPAGTLMTRPSLGSPTF
jgi:hypothetical protein